MHLVAILIEKFFIAMIADELFVVFHHVLEPSRAIDEGRIATGCHAHHSVPESVEALMQNNLPPIAAADAFTANIASVMQTPNSLE